MIKILVSFGVLLAVANSQFLHGSPFIANYASSYNSHIINHDVRLPLQPVVATYALEPLVAPRIAQSIAPVIAQASPDVISARLAVGPQFQDSNLNAQRRSSEPERLQNGPSEKLVRNDRPNDIPTPVLLGSRYLARNQVKPTPVPNGFVFSSRVVSPEQGNQEERGQVQSREGQSRDEQSREDQRREAQITPGFRTAQFQIMRSSALRYEEQLRAEDGQNSPRRLNDGQMANARLEKPEEPKPVASNGRPNIYSQIITF